MISPLTEVDRSGIGPPQDQRADLRHAVAIKGTVLTPYGEKLPVVVVDLSAGGCQLRLSRPLELSQRFYLQFLDLVYVCERRWAKDLSVGVQFLDLCSRVRRRELSTTEPERPNRGAHRGGDILAPSPGSANVKLIDRGPRGDGVGGASRGSQPVWSVGAHLIPSALQKRFRQTPDRT
jgi:PilZ domain